jgi:protein-L-isoaspartate(D-aspartate) O-methyltransferase
MSGLEKKKVIGFIFPGAPARLGPILWILVLALFASCRNGEAPVETEVREEKCEEAIGLEPEAPIRSSAIRNGPQWTERREERERMVALQIANRGIEDPRVLQAMKKVPRHLFVPKRDQRSAYADHPLPIGYGQTISQPYIVAFMTEALACKASHKVLEIGTGSGYQAAILAELVESVFTIEIVEELGKQARGLLQELGYDNVRVHIGDGYRGWPEEAPFDTIIVTAAPDHVPQPLIDQLKPGGRLVIPVGGMFQELLLITKTPEGVSEESILPVIFVPMTGEAQDKSRD